MDCFTGCKRAAKQPQLPDIDFQFGQMLWSSSIRDPSVAATESGLCTVDGNGLTLHHIFFCDESRPRCVYVCDSVKLLLTKVHARFFEFPWYQVYGFSFERFPRPWQNGSCNLNVTGEMWLQDDVLRPITATVTASAPLSLVLVCSHEV